ncbi:unnamed protein product, partial [Ectocarpus sp. 4 AP-2014]
MFDSSRSARTRAGVGGRPSQGEGRMGSGAGGRAVPSTGVAGGTARRDSTTTTRRPRVQRQKQQQQQQQLRYSSPGEERAVRMEIEKGLRLRRLEQVRQQSRQQAAAVREEYRRRQ